MVTFINNRAITSATIVSQSSYTFVKETSIYTQQCHTLWSYIFVGSSHYVIRRKLCIITFKDNKATESGGALYITAYSTTLFAGCSKVTYSNNEVTQYGGAVYCGDNYTR